jgi:hypothetical protein
LRSPHTYISRKVAYLNLKDKKFYPKKRDTSGLVLSGNSGISFVL